MGYVVHCFDSWKQVFVEFPGRDTPSITIERGNVEIEYDAPHPGNGLIELLTYDLCALLALWQECYGTED